MDLVYRAADSIEDLELGECTVRASAADGRRWWQLWTWVQGVFGEPGYVAVPVTPGGDYAEIGPSGRRTWGLRHVIDNVWQVNPSIDVRAYVDAGGRECAKDAPGAREVSWWHQTPRLVGVPEGERWTREPP